MTRVGEGDFEQEVLQRTDPARLNRLSRLARNSRIFLPAIDGEATGVMELEDQACLHVLNFCPRRKFLDGDFSQMVGISNRDVDQEVIWTSHVVNGNDFSRTAIMA